MAITKQALAQAERDGFLRTPRKQPGTEATERWWSRCIQLDQPWIVLMGVETKRLYLKIDTATKRSVRGLTMPTVWYLERHWRWVCDGSKTAHAWFGPEHLTFDGLTLEEGEELASEFSQYLRNPRVYELYEWVRPAKTVPIISLDEARRRRRPGVA